MAKAQRMSIETQSVTNESNGSGSQGNDVNAANQSGMERYRRLDDIILQIQEQDARGIEALCSWLSVIGPRGMNGGAMQSDTAWRMVRAVGGYMEAMSSE